MPNFENSVLDYNSTIQDTGDHRKKILLPEGDYHFKVTKVERGEFPGSSKLPRCKMINLTQQITADAGTVEVRTSLFLHSKMQWKLVSFFKSIGLMQPGEEFVMDWNKVPGTEGTAHVVVRSYMYKDKEYQKNEVSYFIDTPENSSTEVSSEIEDDF